MTLLFCSCRQREVQLIQRKPRKVTGCCVARNISKPEGDIDLIFKLQEKNLTSNCYQTSEILFSPQEDKSYITKLVCNVLFIFMDENVLLRAHSFGPIPE